MSDYLPKVSDLIPLLPGAGIGIILLLAAGWFHRKQAEKAALTLAGAALGAAHLVTYFRIKGMPPFPPVQATERMVYAVAVFTAGGIAAALLQNRPALKGLMQFVLAGGLVFYLLEPLLTAPESAESHVSTLQAFLLAGGILVFWNLVEETARRNPGPALPLTLSLLCGTGGQVFLLYGSASLAQLAGAAAMTLGLAGVLARWLPAAGFPMAAAGALTGIAAGVGLDGYYFITETPPAACLLAPLAAPILLYAARLPKIRNHRPITRFLLQMVLVLLLLGASFWVAAADSPAVREKDPYSDLYEF